jgi:hypothetical protein
MYKEFDKVVQDLAFVINEHTYKKLLTFLETQKNFSKNEMKGVLKIQYG